MNKLQVFNYGKNEVRTVQVDGEPWFVAKDVCDALEIVKHRDAIALLDKDERGLSIMDTPGGPQQFSTISEPGLYSLILRSRKPEAKAFKQWITHEVIPTIRKTGGAYLTAQKAEELLANPDLIISLAQQVKALKEENKSKSIKIEADRPKTVFADAVSASHTSILVGELAKLLRQNDISIGQNRLFIWPRDNGCLIINKLLEGIEGQMLRKLKVKMRMCRRNNTKKSSHEKQVYWGAVQGVAAVLVFCGMIILTMFEVTKI